MRFNKTLLIFILASLAAHALFLTVCYLAPKSETGEGEPSAWDCAAPTAEPAGSATGAGSGDGLGGAPGVAGVGLGSESIGGAALGPKATLRTEMVFWPCCGPKCRSEIDVPQPLD